MTGIAVVAGPPTTAFLQLRGAVVPLLTGLTDECRVTGTFSSLLSVGGLPAVTH